MAQEALQNTARPRFAVRTTAVCRGCFEGNSGTTPGIAREFRPESWILAGVGGGRWWRASVAGVGGGRRWRASRRSRRRSRTKTPVSLINATKAPPAPKTQKHHAQRTPSGGATRVTQDRRRDDTPPIASRVRPQDDDSTTPGGGIGPPRRHPAPGTSKPRQPRALTCRPM